uniref:High light inducible protein n=1 Tax=Rhodosorus marinus TaxID=101924 RepID=A0A7S3A2W6_9RHOD|mmetsp:Transcript_41076/g.162369  ORF Transcript_41076/g.162369 Transcript_41076/m.162369 type:complete len:106 (+) Transcript_41076:850-1167(+)|eukprot:CAMPEP_0113965454 /NCGR_PEP_ID=MMETSP0011_2-20120614/7755_1 /TAXON_ID=101924 /ORGANISM="Rhodosorus marinus" /LENGTH=105 /DNA_ID=CAMNT_0000977971 /DNA_START=744 /DNA_END=1061 /DNA_ORIENTATION=+ /assembly_acc=CAM_ASM_000156
MAFVSGSSFVGQRSGGKQQICKRAVNTATVKMMAKKENSKEGEEEKIIVTLDDLKRDEKRSGWTFHSENWNGRIAMLGMIIAIGTEQINPAHPTIAQQLGALIGQ